MFKWYTQWERQTHYKFIKSEKARIKKEKRKHNIYSWKSWYRVYLKSDIWIKRRELFWKKNKRICFCCWWYATSIHHKNYARIWNEKNSDLIPVCDWCHKKIHDIINKKISTIKTAHLICKSK